jgi:hypothetical protein
MHVVCWPLPQLAAQMVPVFDPQQTMPLPHVAFDVQVTPTRPPSAEPLLDPEELPELLPLELPLVPLELPLELPLDPPELLPLLLPLPGLSLLPLLHPKSAAATTDTTPTARPIFMTVLLASSEVLELSPTNSVTIQVPTPRARQAVASRHSAAQTQSTRRASSRQGKDGQGRRKDGARTAQGRRKGRRTDRASRSLSGRVAGAG